ncbi:hypothetical protein AK830_g115 [Neonectria ditissima]|uniref:Zn(2)-C6 fungal-type domain-containing protein n=1 Tax=Neonectria ditissima TaxID=78410 RepID=A0A0N8H968_9HYPO|nr:hypothetical protein AK830_g115 [Neonectria ditissima]
MGSEFQLTPTSEPEQGRRTASPPVYSQTSLRAPRSCYGCNRKKIRCDKNDPCSSCARAGKPCTFPPSGPRTRRAKKTIIADMASRISSLEKSLAQAKNEAASAQSTPSFRSTKSTPSTQPETIPISSGHPCLRSGEDVLVQNGSSSQYFNEVLFSKFIEDEQNLESILSPPQTSSPYQPASSPFNALGILSSPCLSILPAGLHPPKQLAVKLWNIYVDNVDGCMGLKLLHLPTDEVRVYSVISDPTKASLEELAFCFAIYFASTVSLDGPVAQVTLGQDKHTFLLQLKLGLEQSFAQGDFLDCPNLTGLFALAIYLPVLRISNRSKGMWILNGLAIRIAQSLGLHCDGRRLGLSPFQSEIRRRLWWHLLSRDGRAGEDYGLENTNSLLLESNVDLPLNVDDTDLLPDMKQLPASKPSWTAMTFSLINIELAKAMQNIAAIASASSPASLSEDTRLNVIKETRMRVEKRLEHCNPVLPQHNLTIRCSQFLLQKLDFVTRLQWILLQRTGLDAEFATEQNLTEALEILQPSLCSVSKGGLLAQFAWVRKAYPQYHVTMYVLWHLCLKPEGPNIDRAWEAVESLFSGELWDESTRGFGPKAAVLAALKAKATLVREGIQKQTWQDVQTDGMTESGLCQDQGLSLYLLGDTSGSELNTHSIADEWPDWETLVQNFQFDGPEVN